MANTPDLDRLGKAQFMEALLAARDRLGSTVQLSLALNLEPRRCQAWVSGKMPAYAVMQSTFLRLTEISLLSDIEIKKIIEKNKAKQRRGKS